MTVAAAVVLLTACGGSNAKDSASSASTTKASASTTSADAAGSDFCIKAASALNSVEPALTGSENDPATLGPALQHAADQVRAIKPPSEISSDWASLADGIEQIAQIVVRDGTADPTSASAQQKIGALVGQLTTSAASVQTYLSEKCGLVVPSGTSAPSS